MASLSALLLATVALSPLGGPEIVAHDLPSFVGYASSNGERAFSAGAVWCNLGQAPAAWEGSSANHPISVLNLVRVENGVLRHLGASWASHQVCALQTAICASCTPAGSGCAPALGVGCSTSSTASSLGVQTQMSRRSDVNPSTGAFPFPFAAGSPSGSLERRCRAAIADIDPALHPNAIYAFELVTIHPSEGDASARCVTRRVTTASMLGTPLPQGPANEGSTAIDLWAALVPGVVVSETNAEGDGRVLVASAVTEIGRGLYRYDYAIENIDSHDAIESVRLALPPNATASDATWHAPAPHSGEPTSSTPWTIELSAREIAWAGERFVDNPNANALRWGTTASLSVVVNRPPASGSLSLTRFRSATTVALAAIVPAEPSSAADLDGDGTVAAADLSILLGAWGSCVGCPADLSGDGTVDATDLAILIGAWNAG